MKDLQNKMQQAEPKAATCPKCGGSGKTKKATGGEQMCFTCRGTGVSSGSGYQTK